MGKVLIAYADHDGELATSYWRCFIPARELSRSGHDVKLAHISRMFEQNLTGVDAVLAERILTTEMIDYIRQWPNCRIVFTFDDSYEHLPVYHPAREYWFGRGNIRTLRKVIQRVDLNITPSEELNRLYASAGKFMYMPNYIDRERWESIIKIPKQGGQIVIGGGYSSGHRESFKLSGIIEALWRLKSKYGRKIKIVLYGADSTFSSLRDRDVDFESRKWVNWKLWPLEATQFDIFLAPSVGQYDKFRSNLRLVEAGMLGIPFVASNHGPYRNSSPGGLTVTNGYPGEWVMAIEALMDSEQRRSFGEAGKWWAGQFYIDYHVGEYEEALFNG